MYQILYSVGQFTTKSKYIFFSLHLVPFINLDYLSVNCRLLKISVTEMSVISPTLELDSTSPVALKAPKKNTFETLTPVCLSRNHDPVTQDNLPASCELFDVGNTFFLVEIKILAVDFMVGW